MKRQVLERHLRESGCLLDHRGGKHDVWINPANFAQAPVPRHTEINTFTAKGICRELRIPVIKAR